MVKLEIGGNKDDVLSGGQGADQLVGGAGNDNQPILDRSLGRHCVVGLGSVIFLIFGVGVWAATTDISGAVVAAGTLVVDSFEIVYSQALAVDEHPATMGGSGPSSVGLRLARFARADQKVRTRGAGGRKECAMARSTTESCRHRCSRYSHKPTSISSL